MSQEQSPNIGKKNPKKQMPKLSGVRQQEQVIRTEQWVNQETGEVRAFTVIDRTQAGDYGFHKVWLEDLSRIIGVLGGNRVKVFSYILNNLNPVSNQFGGTIREVSDLLNIDKTCVQSTITTLVQHGFMKRVRTGTYQISANMLVKGNHQKRAGLMLTYDKLEGASPESVYTSENI